MSSYIRDDGRMSQPTAAGRRQGVTSTTRVTASPTGFSGKVAKAPKPAKRPWWRSGS